MADRTKAEAGISDGPGSRARKAPGKPKTDAPPPRNIAIACQGGGAQAAYTAGVLAVLIKKIADDDAMRWVAISGTSGGALSAAVAWFTALESGCDEVATKLLDFWRESSAQRPGEQWHNTLGVLSLDLQAFDFQLNPYAPPLSLTNLLNADIWPLAASLVPPLSAFIRYDYFVRNKLLERYLDFPVIGHLGAFLSLPASIDAWQAAGMRDVILGGAGLDSSGRPLTGQGPDREILARAERALDALIALRTFAGEHPNGLVARVFGADRATDEYRRVDAIRVRLTAALNATRPVSPAALGALLGEIRTAIEPLRDGLPHLLIGATNAGTGEFVAFSSRRAPNDHGISADTFAATTAIPWLFEGTEIPDGLDGATSTYWDGLFSQNPPITDFLSGTSAGCKPDEIWVAQVNPQRCDTKVLKHRLADRRNELAGNLSLNQEIAALDAVNARIAAGRSTDGGDRTVQVLRIPMDSDCIEGRLGWPLAISSKMDRSLTLMHTLFHHGEAQANSFLPVRKRVQLEWNDPDAPTTGIDGLPGGIAGLRASLHAPDMRFQVVDLVLEAPNPDLGGSLFPGESRRARISWCCHLAVQDPAPGQPGRQRLEGIAVVGLDDANTIIGARMTSIALRWPDSPSKPVTWRTLPNEPTPAQPDDHRAQPPRPRQTSGGEIGLGTFNKAFQSSLIGLNSWLGHAQTMARLAERAASVGRCRAKALEDNPGS